MQIKELILQSWDALTRNRLRSILTMMGIVWGLTTVVLLLGYGESVSQGVLNAFLGIGNSVIMVWEGQTSRSEDSAPANAFTSSTQTSRLSAMKPRWFAW